VNLDLILDECFRVQLRGYRKEKRVDDFLNPIGPFLTMYITKYLLFYWRYNAPLAMGTFEDIQREISKKARTCCGNMEEGSNKQQCLDVGSFGPALESDPNWG
jgi:hypothetical protein